MYPLYDWGGSTDLQQEIVISILSHLPPSPIHVESAQRQMQPWRTAGLANAAAQRLVIVIILYRCCCSRCRKLIRFVQIRSNLVDEFDRVSMLHPSLAKVLAGVTARNEHRVGQGVHCGLHYLMGGMMVGCMLDIYIYISAADTII